MTGLKVGHRSHMSAKKWNRSFRKESLIHNIKRIFKGRFIIIK